MTMKLYLVMPDNLDPVFAVAQGAVAAVGLYIAREFAAGRAIEDETWFGCREFKLPKDWQRGLDIMLDRELAGFAHYRDGYGWDLEPCG